MTLQRQWKEGKERGGKGNGEGNSEGKGRGHRPTGRSTSFSLLQAIGRGKKRIVHLKTKQRILREYFFRPQNGNISTVSVLSLHSWSQSALV